MLHPDDLVVVDDLREHDLFSPTSQRLRKMEELWRERGELCDVFSPQECLNYFRHAGYRKTTKIQTNPCDALAPQLVQPTGK